MSLNVDYDGAGDGARTRDSLLGRQAPPISRCQLRHNEIREFVK